MRILYLNPNSLEKELSIFESFKSIEKGFHIEKSEKGESPDYLLDISQRKIGLEITTLVLDRLAAIRSAQNQCLSKASQLSKQNGLKSVEVKVKFRSDYDPIDIDLGARELVELVGKKLLEIDDTKSWHYYESGLKYSKWISIQMGTVKGCQWLLGHRFLPMHMNWMRRDVIGDIQACINKKQTKIIEYLKKCDECWLLIGVDEWTAPEAVVITEAMKTHVFSSNFQRLFFLRNIERTLVELKINQETPKCL